MRRIKRAQLIEQIEDEIVRLLVKKDDAKSETERHFLQQRIELWEERIRLLSQGWKPREPAALFGAELVD